METLFFRQPRLVVLALFVLIVSGISALLTIGRQEDPTITNLFASITTVYPGADPGRVEALVTAKIETRLRTIPEIAEISSTSASSVSVVLVELADTLPAGRIEEAWSRIRDALADVRRDFPPGVQEPEFNSDGAGGYAAIFAITVPAGQSLARAAREAEALADALRAVPGTRLVDLHGTPAEEVLVSVDPARAAALGLTADAIAAAIRAADAKVQAGRLRGTASDILLGVSGEITALDRLRRVVVREDSAGRAVLLGDIADVTRGAREPPAEAALHRGEPAILVSAKLEDGLQVDRWMARMRATADRFGASMPAGLQVELVFD
jgi:multidrug efflux pump subunit AcrB